MARTVNEPPVLSPEHRESLLRGSSIAEEVVKARGYRTVNNRAELRRLGFSDTQARTPSLLIPVWGVDGEIVAYQIRADTPRISKGKAVKYETPQGSKMVLDIHPSSRSQLGDHGAPLFVTEGIKKGDTLTSRGCCAVALLGVWNWRGSNESGGKTLLPDWESVALNGRRTYIVFDSDVMLKAGVHAALARLKPLLEHRGADVALIYLPSGYGGSKQGVDDFLASGHTIDDLLALATIELRPFNDEEERMGGPYRVAPHGLVWSKPTQSGPVEVPLTNFSAKIIGDIAEDDGAEVRRMLEMEAHLNGKGYVFTVSAAQFGGMNWAMERLGAGAIVLPGFGTRDHARAAIQLLSGDVPERRVYAHTGWRKVGEVWVYLHGEGAIGPDGSVAGVEVNLPDALERFVLPEPSTGPQQTTAIKASLNMLEVASDSVTVPAYAATMRAVLGGVDCSEHIVGGTGEGKSEIAALGQQHYGAGFDARHLPGAWSSTDNALEGIAFVAKDALFVIDDFAPAGGGPERDRWHRKADRVLRAQGNGSGRGRMRADGSLRAMRPPRGLILSTGEDVPQGQSLVARTLVVEIDTGAMDWARLAACQRDASEGLYAQAMAGFLRWLAVRYDEMQQGLRSEVTALREYAYRNGQHRRTPGIVADLAVGLRYFLRYAQEVGAIAADENIALWDRCWDVLNKVAQGQAQHQDASEPTRGFVELLRAAITSGHAHVAGPGGGMPKNPGVCGWRRVDVDWRPGGDRIGWVDGHDLFLEPNASYVTAQQLANRSGDAIGVRPKTLNKRLNERGLLASIDEARGTLTVRRSLGGARRNVLHLRGALLIPGETAQPDQTDQGSGSPGTEGQFDWSDSGADSNGSSDKTAQENCPFALAPLAGKPNGGQIGQLSDPHGALLVREEPRDVTKAGPWPSPDQDPWDPFLEGGEKWN